MTAEDAAARGGLPAPEPPRSGSRLRRWLKRLTLLAVTVVVALALGEIALRCLGIPGELEQEWLLLPDRERGRVFDRQTLFANLEFLDENHFRTEPGRKTIVALGDSFTAGFKVAPEESYRAVALRHLRGAGIDARIIDMGVGYSGNDIHLAVLKHWVLPRVRPDIVIWQLCGNDFWENIDLSLYRIDDDDRLVPHGVDRNWLFLRERLCRAVPAPLGFIKRTHLFRLLLDATKVFWASEVPAEYEDRLLEYGRKKARLAIDEAVRLSKKHGFELIFAQVDPQALHLTPAELAAAELPDWCLENYEAQAVLVAGRDHYVDSRFGPEDLAAVNRRFSTELSTIGHGLFLSAADDIAGLGRRHYNRYGYWVFGRKIGAYLVTHRDRLFD